MTSKKIAIIICAIGIAVLIRFVFLGCGIEKDLKKRKIPVVEGHYSLIGKESGSFFAAWYFVAFKMNDELDFDMYRHKIELDAGEGLSVGTEMLVVAGDISEKELEEFSLKNVQVYLKRKLNGKYIDWWKTDSVESGWVYRKELPDSCGYWVMFDDKQKTVYVYWHYS